MGLGRSQLVHRLVTTKNTASERFIMNWANKLECYIAQGWKGLIGTNTLAYCPIHNLQRK